MSDLSMLGQAALGYVREGFAVFPLCPRDKRPIPGSRGFKDASHDPADIERWWTNEPDANIGIATGAASGGVFVIDVDDGHTDGDAASAALGEWEAEHGELPETRVSSTGSGGRHILFRCPPGVSIKSAAGVVDHVDVRGDGGYIVAPPSTHPNGNMYAWEDWSADIATANDSALALARNGRAQERKRYVLPEVIPEGTRVTELFRYASSLQENGMLDDQIIISVHDANKARCTKPLSEEELRREVLTGVISKFPKGEPRGKRGEGQAEVERTSKGSPVASIANCVAVLEGDARLAGRFRYNEFSYTKEVVLPLPWDSGEDPRPVTDVDYINFTRFLEAEYGFARIKSAATDAVIAVCDRERYNPVTTWLDSLEWDGEEHVRDLPALLDCERNEYNTAVMWLTMMGAVYRAYEPGCKMDYMTVLVGAQGIGKSEFVRLLAHDPEWTTDNFNTISGDDGMEKVRGMWIAEMAELLATKRAKDVEAIKAFITSRVDTFRPKYGRETVQRPRRCIFIGTTNDSHFLTDTTGNRRFLPMVCRQPAQVVDPMLFDPRILYEVEQAWAEVVHRYKTEHPPLRLPPHIERIANDMREEFTEEMPLVGIIEEWLDGRWRLTSEGSSDERVCVREIVDKCLADEWKHFDPNKLQNMVIDAMERLPVWVRQPRKMKTRKYGSQRVWIPKRTDKGEIVNESDV